MGIGALWIPMALQKPLDTLFEPAGCDEEAHEREFCRKAAEQLGAFVLRDVFGGFFYGRFVGQGGVVAKCFGKKAVEAFYIIRLLLDR